jgi:putative transposase
MQLSALGRIAQESWPGIPSHSTSVQLHESIVMPNHVHGIIGIVQARVVGPGAAPLQTKDRRWE